MNLLDSLQRIASNDLEQWLSHERGESSARSVSTDYFGAIVGGRQPSTYAESPYLWNRYLSLCDIPAAFVPLDIDSVDGVKRLLEVFRAQDRFFDLTITDPYKQHVLSLASSVLGERVALSRGAAACRAINHFVRTGENDMIAALNTDGLGMARSMASIVSIRDSQVLIIGAGGAARSISYELLRRGASLMIASDFVDELESLQRGLERYVREIGPRISVHALETVRSLIPQAYILLNTVPVASRLGEIISQDVSHLRLVAETTYGAKASLADFASEKRVPYLSGLHMLFGQFQPAARRVASYLKIPIARHREAIAVIGGEDRYRLPMARG